MSEKPDSRWGDGRIEITKKWAVIRDLLNRGWPMTKIYRHCIEPSVISYGQFVRHVAKHLEADRLTQKKSEEEKSWFLRTK